MKFRSGFSFRTAVGHAPDFVARLAEIGSKVVPISDRASTFGYVDITKEAEKKGLRPIYGVELAVTASVNAKKPTVDYWSFFAIEEIEAVNILLQQATEQFRYEPLITYEQAMAAKGLIKIVGHRALLEHFSPQHNLFIALQPSASKAYLAAAIAAGHKLIACSDNKFLRPEDKGLYEIICGRNASTQTYPQWIMSPEEWKANALTKVSEAKVKEALTIREGAIKKCRAVLRKGEMLHPKKPKTLRRMCEEGAKAIGCDLKNKVYKERLDRELKLIKEKDFEDYFYIIADVVSWARRRMVVGPARGSSCGSLVCFLLRITTIDPIRYGLIFERFIDVNRADLPDIDIDFSDQKRQMVFDYMKEKYGEDHVARLGTVAVYRPRSAISETGAALKIPKWKCEAVLESIIERSSGDSRALQALEDTFKDTGPGREFIAAFPEMSIASRMEGHPRHYSQHAAGIILTEKPVRHYVAIDARTGGTHCDKKDAEFLNLLKIDALGLVQLSIFEDALKLAGLPHDHLETVPLDDPEAFRVLNEARFSGIFQFNGMALQGLAQQITANHVEDLISITALARPGPMTTGAAHSWAERKNGKPVEYPHPIFQPHLEGTLGIVIYQEQVMTIAREIGGLSWEDVSKLRRAMSQTLGVEFFDKFGDPWKEGAKARGVPEDILDKLWQDLCAFGAMGFNRSHAVAYGLVSYWCCWLKAHFPHEFAAATLTHETDPAKQIKLLRELKDEGIDYVPVDAELSIDRWTVGHRAKKRFLIGPLQNIKGIGPKGVTKILSHRARPEEKLPASIAKALADPKTEIDSLFPIRDAFARLLPDPTAKNIHTVPTPIAKIGAATDRRNPEEVVMFCVLAKIAPRDRNEIGLVNQRNGKLATGQTSFLDLRMMDDTDTIFGRVYERNYEKVGKPIVDRGSPGKCLYAIKGYIRGNAAINFRMIEVFAMKYIGTLNEEPMAIDNKEKANGEED